MLTKTYFSLGFAHAHTLPLPDGDIVWQKDGLICVEAENQDVAEGFINAMFGVEWSACYKGTASFEQNIKTYWPKGIVHTYTILPGNEFESQRN